MDVSASSALSADPAELSIFGLKIGSTLAGKYVIESVIGSGGMSVVVRALHTMLGQPVALKLLRPELANDAIHVERFLREALAAAQLKNDHVVRVLDADRLPDGTPYLVMEALEGLDFSKVLVARGPLPVSEVVYYVLQACEAIAEAHARGIVHRDLKPSNLFLTTTQDGTPSVKVLDFGISKLETSTDVRLTGTMVVLGSPLHMSPEQVRDSRTVDRRTDVWSLGTVLFELLTGRPPFYAESPVALIAKIAAEHPEPLAALRSDVPPALERVLMRCLEKDRAQRVQSIEELVRLLSPFAPQEAWKHIERSLRAGQSVSVAPRSGETQRLSDPALLASLSAEGAAAVGLTRRLDRSGVLGIAAASAANLAATPANGPAASVVGWGKTHGSSSSEPHPKRRVAPVAAIALGVAVFGSAAWWWAARTPSESSEPPAIANAAAGGLPKPEALAPVSTVETVPVAPPPEPVPASTTSVPPAVAPAPVSNGSRAPRRPASERASRPRKASNSKLFEERQ